MKLNLYIQKNVIIYNKLSDILYIKVYKFF